MFLGLCNKLQSVLCMPLSLYAKPMLLLFSPLHSATVSIFFLQDIWGEIALSFIPKMLSVGKCCLFSPCMDLWRVLYSIFSLCLPVSLYVVCMHMCIHVCVWSGGRVHACVYAWVWKFYMDVEVKRILQSLHILYMEATSLG